MMGLSNAAYIRTRDNRMYHGGSLKDLPCLKIRNNTPQIKAEDFLKQSPSKKQLKAELEAAKKGIEGLIDLIHVLEGMLNEKGHIVIKGLQVPDGKLMQTIMDTMKKEAN